MQLEIDRNRFISLFSGYLHLPADPLRLQIDYDDFYTRLKPEEDDPARRDPNAPPVAPDELALGRSPLPVGASDPWELVDPGLHKVSSKPFVSPNLVPPPLKPLLPDPVVRSHGSGRPEPREIDVSYGEGGHALDLRVDQINILRDNDIVGSGTEATGPWPEHYVRNMDDLIDIARSKNPFGEIDDVDDVIPQLEQGGSPIGSGADPTGGQSGYSVNEAVHVTGSAHADVDVNVNLGFEVETAPPVLEGATETSFASTLQPGTTIDGVSYAPGTEPAMPEGPQDLVPEVPTDNSQNMAVVDTGGNIAANSAGLVDMQPIGTLMVLGDSYHSNAIVQTNVLVDESAVVGTKDSATVQTGGNEANNVAEFINTLAQNPYEMGFFGGLHWNVDRVSGDLYDVKMVTQLNDMRDNDLVQQVASDHYKYVETGSNLQGNDFSYLLQDKQYDLVIVTGDYYGANWIFQTNVLLNSDYVQVNEGEGGSGDQTVSTGANWLTNSATIVDFTGQAHELTPDMQALVNALQGGSTTLPLDYGELVAGNGGSSLNVLFIDGDYYDINVLQQTNIMEDSDKVLQTLENGESGYVSTGGNELQNNALLVNLGPLGEEYVGGNQYSESVLIQTNIVAQSTDQVPSQNGVVTNDPTKLASEAGVFIEHAPTPAPAPAEQSTAPPPTDTAAHSSDPLASVMS